MDSEWIRNGVLIFAVFLIGWMLGIETQKYRQRQVFYEFQETIREMPMPEFRINETENPW